MSLYRCAAALRAEHWAGKNFPAQCSAGDERLVPSGSVEPEGEKHEVAASPEGAVDPLQNAWVGKLRHRPLLQIGGGRRPLEPQDRVKGARLREDATQIDAAVLLRP